MTAIRAKKRAAHGSQFDSKAEVQKAMLVKLEGSYLDAKDAKRLCMDPITAEDLPGALGATPAIAAGFRIPYFDLSGKPTKFWRFRYLETTKRGFAALTDKKELRYIQAQKSLNELYLPPLVDWAKIAADPDIDICITEGELKAACATKMQFPTIGLGGVWCFKSAKEAMHLLPMFDKFKWEHRRVFICYDDDAITNPMVMQAENALAREFTNLGAEPYIVRLPKLPDMKKTGLDDFLVAKGPTKFADLLAMADPWRAAKELHQLNEEVIYVRDPGVIIEVETLQRIAPRAFVDHAYSTRIFWETIVTEKSTKQVEKSAAKEWIKWPGRAEVQKVTYAPGVERVTGKGELNTWTGWGCEPVEGDIGPWVKLLDYIFRDEPEFRKWFELWCAYPIQHPGVKLFSSVVIHGKYHGTGKTLIGYTLGKIYGRNFQEIRDKDLRTGDNDWAENKQFVLGEEITGGDKRDVADRLKAMITQQSIRINVKYIPKYDVPDCINYLFTSNHPDAFFLEDADRRFGINEVRGTPMPDSFYAEYDAWLAGEGPGRLFHYLLNLDTSGFNPKGHALMTKAKRDMIDSGRSDLASWVAQLVEDPDSVLRLGEVVLDYALWTTQELLNMYDPEKRGRVTANGLGRELRRAGIEKVNEGMGVYTSKGQQRLWALRDGAKYQAMDGLKLGKAYDAERAMPASKKGRKY